MSKLLKRLSESEHTKGLKDVDTKQGIVKGYFAAFNSKDSDGDIIVKGAFAKTIAERGPGSSNCRIRHLMDHDRTKSVCKIQTLTEDDYGLEYVSRAGKHSLGQDYLLMCEDGLITEHSIGYGTIQQNYDRAADANYLTELRLWEGSGLQGWGANPNTPFLGVKEDGVMSEDDFIVVFNLLEKALRTGKYSDETFKTFIEPNYKKLGDYLSQKRNTEPGRKSTQPNTEVEMLAAFRRGLNA
ncbi:HK97 family phage prohead protease [Fibrella forsythiae]|uniref:HK97 family phage prohead protease n=1 Tax=Fibrella forsythiae TaxID=2817061 RepID=A0ABS3JC07_9BACT|nr:HK97 family phage prohead protease [Fibrella forsythiae]MBO0947529.1 HK97 family phage prohead protease [Fibrella forsythiae]